MKPISFFYLLLVCSLILLPSCKSEEDDVTTATSGMDGTWIAGCSVNVDGDYEESDLVVGSGTLTWTARTSRVANCLAADQDTEIEWVVNTLTETGSATITDGTSVTQYTSVLVSATMTPLNADAVTQLQGKCGATWELNVAVSLIGCVEMDMANIAAGDVVKDIYYLNARSLQLGAEDEATRGADGYPTVLDSIVYSKQ